MVSFNWNQPELLERIAKLEEKVAALQRHEERTSIALAQSNVGLFDWHLGNRSIYVSPILQDMLGYEGESMPGHLDAWADHLHADDRSTPSGMFAKRLSMARSHFEPSIASGVATAS